jgi:23S rRNA pseudouridine1911/1915/1917 synthase
MYVDGLPLEPFLLSSEQILYQDNFLLAVNKPAGVATQPTPARFRGTLYDALQVYLTNPWQRHQKPVVGMVQRLDLDTSGVMIFSIHPRAHKNLTNAFREKRVRKIYQALVTGRIDAGQGVIKSQLARRRATNLMVSVQRGGKNAETRYRLLENLGCASLLEIEIPTGRSHQIRAHFSEQGHPLLGDTAYGGPSQINGFQVSRQMLHAHALQFEHPVTSDAMTLTAELPGDFEAVLQKLKSDG